MTYPDAVRRAGHADGEALFDAILEGRSGITFTLDEYEDAWNYVRHADQRIALAVPGLIEELRALGAEHPGWVTEELPFVLSAGERLSSTANKIIRDPEWRKRDGEGALRVSPADAERLGLETGGRARVVTARGTAEAVVEVTDAMLPGHVSLPNGLGVDYPGEDGVPVLTGVPANELTAVEWRDPLAGTPWHKHVPARVEAVA
jgi:formate dehydrogenase